MEKQKRKMEKERERHINIVRGGDRDMLGETQQISILL